MSALVLLTIAVAGSSFARRYPLARYRQLRSKGWDAYFHVASWGTLLLVVAATFTFFLDVLDVPSSILARLGLHIADALESYQITSTQLKVGFACVISMPLGTLLAKFLDIPKNQNAMYQLLLREHDLERMLYQSSTQGTLVQITLKSRKVYIGLVFDGSVSPGIEKHEQFMLYPMLSGYRDKDSLCLELTNSYMEFYENLDPDKAWNPETFQMLILVSEISSMAFYDPSAYQAIQSNLTPQRNSAEIGAAV